MIFREYKALPSRFNNFWKEKKMTKDDYTIRPEREEDFREVENLTREAFWNVYAPGCTEHYVLHCYRPKEDFVRELDLVMEKDGIIIGHIMYVRSHILSIDGRIVPTMTFGPISIAPAHKRRGYGKILLDYSMEKAKEMGTGALAITGNIAFYGKSGFVAAKTKGITYQLDPDGDYFLIKELVPGYLNGISGTFKDPDGYTVNDADFEEYDKQFPPKQKLRLPGQLVPIEHKE